MDNLEMGSRLYSFKTKIDEAVALVPAMNAEEKLRAVQFWNVVSEKLQEIVNDSAADINALAMRFEEEKTKSSGLGSDATSLEALALQSSHTSSYPNPTNPTLSSSSIAETIITVEETQKDPGCNILTAGVPALEDSSISFSPSENASKAHLNESHLESMQINASHVIYSMQQATRANVIQSAPKQKSIPLGSSFPESCSSLTENLCMESESSFVSESGDSSLNIDRFQSSTAVHMEVLQKSVALDMDVETNSMEHIIDSTKEMSTVGPNILPEVRQKSMKTSEINCHNLNNEDHSKWSTSKPFACTECDAKFSTKGNLLVHQRRHTGEKPFSCDKCPASFSTKGNLRRHIKAHSGERSWRCETCDARFTEKKSLKVHMRRHTGERPYKCEICNKAFSQTGVLQTHMALHLDERKYLCEMCGKAFRQRSQLRLHVLRHEGVKRWNCSTCSAKFLTKGDLERHFRTHTGERPFVCSLCGKTFTRQQSLNEHSNRHYGLKPYSCSLCNKKFAEMSACYKHIKIHKKQQEKETADFKSSSNNDSLSESFLT